LPYKQNIFDAGWLNIWRIQVSNEPKVYVIKPTKTSDSRIAPEESAKQDPAVGSCGSGRNRTEPYDYRARNVRAVSAPIVLLSYLLGPLAILTTREGRTSRFWVALAAGSVAVTLSLLIGWNFILSRFGEKGFVILPLMLLTSVSILTGFTVWARAVYLIGRHRALLHRNIPDPLRKPNLIGMLGLLAPGLGLLVTGYYRRAALTLWVIGSFALSLFVLYHAAWLWSWNRGAGSEALQGTTLEHLFIGMGIVGIFGALVWIVQALDGARLAERRFARNAHSPGNAAAFALLAALVVFVLMFQPASVAETLDYFAVSARHEGYRILPLHAELAAMRLDPSSPAFAVKAAELYDQLGRHENAQALREELFERWKPCMVILRQHGMIDPYTGSRASVTDDRTGAGSSDDTEAVDSETVSYETWVGPWDRIRSEYGLFTVPME